MTTATASVSAAPATAGGTRYDLKALLRRTGRVSFGSLSFPEERTDSGPTVEMVEDEPAPVSAPSAPVWGFVDGIQNQMLLGYRGHRPVILAYVAAGAAAAGPRLLDVRERLAIVASVDDVEWVAQVNSQEPPVPIATVASGTPPEVAHAVLERVQVMRAGVETELRAHLLAQAPQGTMLVLDGSLLGSEADPRLGGVVKTSRTRYLKDESTLYGLPPGWRSPIFKIPAAAGTAERYSTYVRLHDARNAEWSFGLIRLETFSLDALEPLAARTLAERQGPASGDGRWDRHLVSVAACEKMLRARRPVVFDLFRI